MPRKETTIIMTDAEQKIVGVGIQEKHPDNNIYQKLQNEKEYLFTELIKARYGLGNCHTSKNKITSDILEELGKLNYDWKRIQSSSY